ncbi:Macrolide export ATP-binding/permease protein MacB [Actinomadura rubteroloni]|uniref:Macrolide export ATP-binding/permease protein MacB n=1 Tax=Actinomadura rubteroloni TaxID=1926885 RepID=A0A2P4UB10_9ACTN|nr:ABC transporter permease [Actinomadura rubteroloni]POM22228.1 Macrolide export ATP-binding/permease protein MacB [Actinomadura rubteroloni]
MMTKVTLRNLMAHKVRLLLTGVAVLLGVAFVAGTLMFTDTMSKQFDDLFSSVGKNVAVDVRAKKVTGGDDDGQNAQPIPASLVDKLKAVDGVKTAEGQVSGYAAVVGRDGKLIGGSGPPQLGVNWTGDDGATRLSSGRAPNGPGEVLLDEETAKKAHYRVGDSVKIIVAGPPQTMRITGLVHTGNMMGATITSFDTATAQRLLLKPGQFSEIQLGSDGVSEQVLRDRVATQLPSGLEAITGTKMRAENKSDVEAFLGFFRTFFLAFALIAVFVGAFIIFNTFSMLVAQRTRELALLRAIGAARRQVTRAVIGEAIAVGIVGSTLGIAVGAGLAVALQRFVGGGGLVFTARTAIVSYLVGTIVTVVSAYFPARRAAKIPPVAAMRDDVALPQRSLRIRLVLGAVLTALGAVLIGLGLGGSASSGTGNAVLVGAGAFAVFIGVTMLAPLISVPVIKVLGWPFAKVLRVPGRLAQQNALRNPRRTASTAAALMIGLALITTVNVLGASIRASVNSQIDDQFGADYLISSSGLGGIDPATVTAITKVPGVKTAARQYDGNAVIAGKKVGYIAADMPTLAKAARLKITSGSDDPGRDGILLDAPTAKARGVAVGSVLPVTFADGKTLPLKVKGVYDESGMVGPRIVSEEAHLAHTARPVVSFVAVDTGGSTAPKAGLDKAVAANPALKVQDQADLKDEVGKQVDGLISFITILLVLSVIIAAVGVINTIALSVVERTREIGLLRAIGMGRRQLRRMIRAESIVIAVFGALLGMGIGIGFGTSLQQALADDGLNILSIPYGSLVTYLIVAAVIGVLAALWPAWRAGRMDVLRAISTE